MKILLPIILFIVQFSYVWTSKTEDTSSNHFEVVTTGATESDSILNYQASAARYHTGKPLLDALLFLPVTFAIFVAIKTIIVMVIIVAMISLVFLCPQMMSTDPSCENILGRSFTQQLFEIRHTLIQQEKLDSLAEEVDKSIEVISKLYH
jgi:hypothetical protein